MGPEATDACQYDHLCAGLKVGIYWAVQGVQDIWDSNLSTVNWVFLLVNARKHLQRDQLYWNYVNSSPFMAIRISFCF